MKSLSRDPTASARARKAEAAADAAAGGGLSVKPIPHDTGRAGGGTVPGVKGGGGGGAATGAGGSGFKKGGFRSAFKPAFADEGDGGDAMDVDVKGEPALAGSEPEGVVMKEGGGEEDTDRWGTYDPRRPTGCMPGCAGLAA